MRAGNVHLACRITLDNLIHWLIPFSDSRMDGHEVVLRFNTGIFSGRIPMGNVTLQTGRRYKPRVLLISLQPLVVPRLMRHESTCNSPFYALNLFSNPKRRKASADTRMKKSILRAIVVVSGCLGHALAGNPGQTILTARTSVDCVCVDNKHPSIIYSKFLIY